MAEREVRWSADAEQDLEGIVDYIALENPLDALRIFDRLRSQSLELRRFAERGRRVPEIPPGNQPPLRELVIAPWRLIYAIDRDAVLVIALVDSRRDVEAWLTQRLGAAEPPAAS